MTNMHAHMMCLQCKPECHNTYVTHLLIIISRHLPPHPNRTHKQESGQLLIIVKAQHETTHFRFRFRELNKYQQLAYRSCRQEGLMLWPNIVTCAGLGVYVYVLVSSSYLQLLGMRSPALLWMFFSFGCSPQSVWCSGEGLAT